MELSSVKPKKKLKNPTGINHSLKKETRMPVRWLAGFFFNFAG